MSGPIKFKIEMELGKKIVRLPETPGGVTTYFNSHMEADETRKVGFSMTATFHHKDRDLIIEHAREALAEFEEKAQTIFQRDKIPE